MEDREGKPSRCDAMKKKDLSGNWNLYMDEGMQGQQDTVVYDDTIELPSTTALAKKGNKNDKREIGSLTEVYPFEGYVWMQKTISIPSEELEKPMELYLERTRITKLWMNNTYIGSEDSLCTPHVYDITGKVAEETVITILVDNVHYKTKGGHMTSPDTQTNWTGITGKMELRVYDTISIRRLQAYPDMEKHEVVLEVEVENHSNQAREVILEFEGEEKSLESVNAGALGKQLIEVNVYPGKNQITYEYSLPHQVSEWSEYTPTVYQIHGRIYGQEEDLSVTFGLRDFKAVGMKLVNNGIPVFLRGKHEGLNYPMTGAAPTSVEEWIRIMSISKEYGINHYRCHTCCPPEAAFEAADYLGIYLEPELPFWGTIGDPGEKEYNEEEQQYLIQEGERILTWYGDHPSFVMMSLGNELWGSKKRLAVMLRHFKSMDSRHLYTQGANNFQHTPVILEEDDFFIGVRFSKERLFRGSYGMCDAPLGFIQTDEPNTVHNYNDVIEPVEYVIREGDKPKKQIAIQYGTGTKLVEAEEEKVIIPEVPVISHEIGQYAVYPDFDEILKYTGPLQARNMEVFRERLCAAGMGDLAKQYHKVTGALAVECYKLELEAAHKTSNLAGYQLLDLQDYSGQGSALVGVLDAFMESKGLVSPQEWREFCSDRVLMAELPTFNMEAGQCYDVGVSISYYRPEPMLLKSLIWTLVEDDNVVIHGERTITVTELGVTSLGSIPLVMPDCIHMKKAVLSVAIPEEDISNHYTLWIHPRIHSFDHTLMTGLKKGNTPIFDFKIGEDELQIVRDLSEATQLLEQGKRVLFIPNEIPYSIEGSYCSDFWCYSMFRSISEWMQKPEPVGTMGLLIQSRHPALKEFTCEAYTTPQWYHIIKASRLAILDHGPRELRPIVQMVDNFERNHKLGLLYEVKVGEGKVLVCTSDLSQVLEHGEVIAFAKSIISYALSDEFNPVVEMSKDEWNQLWKGEEHHE